MDDRYKIIIRVSLAIIVVVVLAMLYVTKQLSPGPEPIDPLIEQTTAPNSPPVNKKDIESTTAPANKTVTNDTELLKSVTAPKP